MIHNVDGGIFHLMARLELRKGRQEAKLALRAAIMGGKRSRLSTTIS
jgi:hypothetical protein